MRSDDEAERMLAENARRTRELAPDFYSLSKPANLFIRHGQERALLWALRRAGALPLEGKRVLEVGCGSGQWLTAFENFGATQAQLSAIELDAERLGEAQARYPAATFRAGDARALPWDDASFDVVWQSTVFTSILDAEVRMQVAREMVRVLRPGGAILWYDFAFDNPKNAHVRGIKGGEIRRLFPSCDVRMRRVTLAPPIARRVAPRMRLLAEMLEQTTLLNTHLIAVIRPWTESASSISR